MIDSYWINQEVTVVSNNYNLIFWALSSFYCVMLKCFTKRR